MVHSGYFEYKKISRGFQGAEIFTDSPRINKAIHCHLSGLFVGKRVVFSKSIVTAVFILSVPWIDILSI